MRGYGPSNGLHICLMGHKSAEAHTRRVHNVPDNVGLGWTPYTVIVTSYGGISHKAFHSVQDLKRWLGRDYRVRLAGRQHQGIRVGRIEEVAR